MVPIIVSFIWFGMTMRLALRSLIIKHGNTKGKVDLVPSK